MNYSGFHNNRVRYNINTTNKAKSKMCIIYILKINNYILFYIIEFES